MAQGPTTRFEKARLEIARAKLERKGCDFLVLNRVGWAEGFQREDTAIQLLARGGEVVAVHLGAPAGGDGAAGAVPSVLLSVRPGVQARVRRARRAAACSTASR